MQLMQYESKYAKAFDVITVQDDYEIDNMFSIYHQSYIPIGYQIDESNKCDDLHFITITFDPKKFGHEANSEKEERYILYSLYEMKKHNNITDIYGSFEKHKNGRTHAHLLIFTPKSSPFFKSRLQSMFTDNMNNTKAVDMEVCKNISKCKAYIDKDPYPKTWFTYGDNWKVEMVKPRIKEEYVIKSEYPVDVLKRPWNHVKEKLSETITNPSV